MSQTYDVRIERERRSIDKVRIRMEKAYEKGDLESYNLWASVERRSLKAVDDLTRLKRILDDSPRRRS